MDPIHIILQDTLQALLHHIPQVLLHQKNGMTAQSVVEAEIVDYAKVLVKVKQKTGSAMPATVLVMVNVQVAKGKEVGISN